jgi:hypothetical protein
MQLPTAALDQPMPYTNLAAYPPTIRAQLTDLLDVLTALLGQNLAGVYATPLAPTADTPALRLLVVTARDILRDTKLGLVQALLRRSTHPTALELLVVRHADLVASQPALLIQLHFAEGTRPQFTADTTSLLWLRWPDGPSGSVDRATLLAQLEPHPLTLVGVPLASLQSTTTPTPTPAPVPEPRPEPWPHDQQLRLGDDTNPGRPP